MASPAKFTRGTVTFWWICAACGQDALKEYSLEPGMEVPLPTFPVGWRDVEGALLCPKHRVQVFVDYGAMEGGVFAAVK